MAYGVLIQCGAAAGVFSLQGEIRMGKKKRLGITAGYSPVLSFGSIREDLVPVSISRYFTGRRNWNQKFVSLHSGIWMDEDDWANSLLFDEVGFFAEFGWRHRFGKKPVTEPGLYRSVGLGLILQDEYLFWFGPVPLPNFKIGMQF